MAKSWSEKFRSGKPPHVEVMDKACFGLVPGQRLVILDPPAVDATIRKIPRGQSVSVAQLRKELATAYDADAACPISTGIFVRIVAEVALEKLASGEPPDAVTPFWRVVDTESPVAKKLSCGPEFIQRLREAEGI